MLFMVKVPPQVIAPAGRLIWSLRGVPLLRFTFIKVTLFNVGELLNVRVPVVPPAPGASVPLLTTVPLTEPLPDRVCAAPRVKPPATADTSKTAPPAIAKFLELAMEPPLAKASVPALMVVVPV